MQNVYKSKRSWNRGYRTTYQLERLAIVAYEADGDDVWPWSYDVDKSQIEDARQEDLDCGFITFGDRIYYKPGYENAVARELL